MSSTTYEIRWDSFNVGGDDTSSSTTYQLRDTIGDLAVDGATSTTYDMRPGYREGIYDRTATFEIFIKNRASQVAATSYAGSTVGVSSTAGISVGGVVLLVENEGFGQNSAIGRVTSIGALSIDIDFETNSGTTPSINGTGDYLYRMDGTSMAFGALSTAGITTSSIGWEVNADVDEGYSVYIYEDHNLTLGGLVSGNAISDVSDGTVSIGSTEYGARSSDKTLASSTFDTNDSAITSSLLQVGSRADNSFQSRDFLTFKASRSSSAAGGTYSHTVYLIYVGDY
ncbi:MAG: hypothetical protein ABIA47_03235 [bacterium]